MHTTLALLLTVAAAPPAPTDEVVARVGVDSVTHGDLKARIAATHVKGGNTKPELLIEDLINDTLLSQSGYRQGLDKQADVVAKVAQERARLAGEKLVERELSGAVHVTDEQLSQTYHDSGDTVRFSLIVVASQEAAAAVVQRLKAGTPFATEASKSLDPTSAAKGGDVGVKTRGQLEAALKEPLFQAPLGQVHGPLKLELGWGVYQVVSRQLADAKGLELKKPELRRFLESQLKVQLRQHYVLQLRAQAKVALDEAFLTSTGVRLTASAEEQDKVVATVGKRPIRYGDVLALVVSSLGGKEGGHFSGASVKQEFAWTLVDRALLEDAAMERGLGKLPEVDVATRRFERDEVARANVRRLRAQADRPTDERVAAWYLAHPQDVQRPAERACSHLVVREKSHALGMKDRLAKGEAFDDVARSASLDDATAEAGGALGTLTDERVAVISKSEPALAKAFKDTPAGQVSAPVQSRMGWHLVRCGPTTPAGPRPLPEVKAAISARLSAEAEALAVLKHLDGLRAKATITKDAAALGRVTESCH